MDDQRRMIRFRQILDFPYFKLKPGSSSCPIHPNPIGTAFPVTSNLSLLDLWLSQSCKCDIYGISEVRLSMLVADGEISHQVETDSSTSPTMPDSKHAT